ncbi:MAG: secretin N-terminal domain-containing protein [Alphaproteobacteria bacterium]|nr:secretin N-terminal domain-containing protein [Alphaproteobacteria bacterium]
MKPFLLYLMVFIIAGCSYDKEAELSKEDYRNLNKPKKFDAVRKAEPPIPELHSIIASPAPPVKSIADTKRVTISITDTTPLRDVFIELARRASLDLELDPNIRGGIIFSAIDRTVKEVVERICNISGLVYELENNVLHIERDEPHIVNYQIETLNLTRASKSKISTNTDVFSAVSGGGGGEGNSSTSQITSETSNDFWAEIESNIEKIISVKHNSNILINYEAQTLQLAPVVPKAIEAQDFNAETGLNLPTENATALSISEQNEKITNSFTINKVTGIISVYGSSKVQKSIKEYIDKIKNTISSQVLIEAKIVEVSLSEQFRSGINWQSLSNSNFNFSTKFGRSLIFPSVSDIPPTGAISFRTGGGADINGLVDLISSFGTVRTLSSPRLTVMNNQTAVLKVAENEVYFKIELEREDLENGTSRANITSTLNTVPIGLVMNVQPIIERKSGQITMALRPTISRISRYVSDPGVALSAASLNVEVESLIPVVEVRELDSVITIQTGEIVIMGGLMQEKAQKTENGIPIIQDIPILGRAFKGRNDVTEVTELVIFLRATIIEGCDSITPTDESIYNKFAKDPRPIAF